MSVAQETPVRRAEAPQTRAPRVNGRWAGYSHLLAARMLELKREPEVVFWVFVFPLLLALGLGIAFRDKPPDLTSIAIVEGGKAQDVLGLLERSPQHNSIHADVLSAPAALIGVMSLLWPTIRTTWKETATVVQPLQSARA